MTILRQNIFRFKLSNTVVAIVSAILTPILSSAYASAYIEMTGAKSISSGTSAWFTVGHGISSWFLLDGRVKSSATSAVALNLPVVYGACIIIMLLCGIVLGITRSYQAVLVTMIAGLIGLLGVVMLESVIIHLFGG